MNIFLSFDVFQKLIPNFRGFWGKVQIVLFLFLPLVPPCPSSVLLPERAIQQASLGWSLVTVFLAWGEKWLSWAPSHAWEKAHASPVRSSSPPASHLPALPNPLAFLSDLQLRDACSFSHLTSFGACCSILPRCPSCFALVASTRWLFLSGVSSHPPEESPVPWWLAVKGRGDVPFLSVIPASSSVPGRSVCWVNRTVD